MRKIMITLHKSWWIFILVGIYILWNSIDLLLGDVYWELYTQQEIIKDCIIRGVLFLFFITGGIIFGLHKNRYIAKCEESMRSVARKNKTDITPKYLSNQDVEEFFVPLFVVEYIQFDTKCIGIWKKNNCPILIRHEVWNKDFSNRYSLVKKLTFEEVRKYAKEQNKLTSIASQHFVDINDNNWVELYNLAKNDLCSSDTNTFDLEKVDIKYNMHKKNL